MGTTTALCIFFVIFNAQGIPVDYPEFVVYDNRRSMIEYIVTFEEVAYRAPPSRYNFYTSQAPSLYKVEPIILPIPEEELDKLYMLGPDTGELPFHPCPPHPLPPTSTPS